MKRILMLVAAIALIGMAGTASAQFSFHYDALNAISNTPFDGNNNTSPVNYPGVRALKRKLLDAAAVLARAEGAQVETAFLADFSPYEAVIRIA